MEGRSVVFSNESRFCLGGSDGRVLVRRRPGERLQPNCLWPRHIGPTTGAMVWVTISYDSRGTLWVIPNTLTENLYVSLVIQPIVLPFMNSIQGGVFQQDNSHPRTFIVRNVIYRVLTCYLSLSLSWPARLPGLQCLSQLSPIDHVWDIIGRQLQHHPHTHTISTDHPIIDITSTTNMDLHTTK
ncbi:transposable element Tc1 transposase [Trichonephila clavipes]|nr:transposable element Tc1 transposase [Trichonephila clavipes]